MMKTKEDLIKSKIFDFIENDKLKNELYSSTHYVNYLNKLSKEEKDQYILFSINHTILVHLWWIIEALLFQYIYKYFSINNDEIKIKKFCKLVEYKEVSKVHFLENLSNEEKGFVYCERFAKYENFKDNINFNFLIKWAKDNRILNNDILEKIDKIRKFRNWVHLNVLLDIRDVLSDIELIEFFNDNREILNEIKKEYIKLSLS